MKKILCILVALLLIVPAGLAEGVDLKSMTEEELRSLRTAIDTELAVRYTASMLEKDTLLEGDIGDYHVAVTELKMATKYKTGEPCAVLSFLFVNNGSEPESFSLGLSVKVYQSGKECEKEYFINEYDISYDEALKNIKNGASIECMESFALYDATTPIEIEIKDLFDWNKKLPTIQGMLLLP